VGRRPLGAVVLAAVILLTARHSLIIRPVLILGGVDCCSQLLMSVGIHLALDRVGSC